ncbi:MAG: hypothetical protein ACE15C_17310 [Phycisphaerae bacterium]
MKWCRLILSYLSLLAAFTEAACAADAQPSPATLPASVAGAPQTHNTIDDALAAARNYVAQHSDRYLDHSKLSRGMKGYGLTVMQGTKIEKFDVEIISVMTRWGPHQDVILARCSGLDLEKSGIIAGMSGSPVYIKDSDGKDKMIGAVAFGWNWPKEPLTGIQPITQMIAVDGFLDLPKPATKPASSVAVSSDRSGGRASPEYLKAVLSPAKIDLTQFGWTGDMYRPAAAKGPRAKSGLVPLATPLMISGASEKARDDITACLKPLNVVPVQGGGVSATDAKAFEDFKFTPGSPVAIPLVAGDADVSAVGTVTEVVGDKILIFGHSFNGEGAVSFPLCPAYVHMVVSGYQDSFKLASPPSPLMPLGALTHDEKVGCGGVIGAKSTMIPVEVAVEWTADGRKQTFKYQIIRHKRFTALAIRYCLRDSSQGWKDLPEFHTVRHAIEIDYGKLGVYKAANISSGEDVYEALSDTIRPVAALMNNPLAEPTYPKSVKIALTIEPGETTAEILNLKLDGRIYKPGDTVEGTLTIRPVRKKDTTMAVKFKLPDDLRDGRYTLNATDFMSAIREAQREMPQRYDPRTVEELFKALQTVVVPQANQVYLSLPLPRGGLALGQKELPDLPESKARLIDEANLLDTHVFTDSVKATMPSQYVLKGDVSAAFTVQAKPQETLLQKLRP